MTSGKIEELEKEAEFRTKGWKEQKNCIQAYLAGAKPREKRIAELTEQNTSLLTSVENLNKSVQELEAQIEKMECCGNCVHFNFNEPNYCHKGVYRERQDVCGEWCFGN